MKAIQIKSSVKYSQTPSIVVSFISLLLSSNLWAQADFTGYWESIMHEDTLFRTAGPPIGEYIGLPINDAAKAIAEKWDPNDGYKPENQCKMHGAAYIMRSPIRIFIENEDDATISIKIELEMGRERKIYLDGRTAPEGPPTDMGHSVGVWEGDMLTVTTTNMTEKYVRRNGVPNSEQAVMTEHFVRHSDYITLISIIEDPVYLTEPLVRSVSYRKRNDEFKWVRYDCEVYEWPGGMPGAPVE
ncbi:MAG TPA: hypothetical protein DCY55_11510 [Gammaproteobacteria bacterium]|jgi:hypothetical protein|nr:hypothetical protein [Gammaproteobacteria bacterium]